MSHHFMEVAFPMSDWNGEAGWRYRGSFVEEAGLAEKGLEVGHGKACRMINRRGMM